MDSQNKQHMSGISSLGRVVTHFDDPQGNTVFSENTSMRDSINQAQMVFNKTIMVQPEELLFNQVVPGQPYVQSLAMQNTLSAPVELISTRTSGSLQRASASGFMNNPVNKYTDVAKTNTQRDSSNPKEQRQRSLSNHKVQIHAPEHNTEGLVGDSFGRSREIDILQSPSSGDFENRAPPFENRTPYNMLHIASGGQESQSLAYQYLRRDMLDPDSNQKETYVDDEMQQMRSQLQEVMQENESLKRELKLRPQQVQSSSTPSECTQLDKIRILLQQQDPQLDQIVQEALKAERSLQEKKDKKILEILQYKDKQIEDLSIVSQSFESKLKAATQQCEELQSKLSNFETDEKFALLLKSQTRLKEQETSISLLNSQIASLKEQKSTSETFLEEACSRAKQDLQEWQSKCKRLESQLIEERVKANQVACMLEKQQQQTSTNQCQKGEGSSRMGKLEETLKEVFAILGRVTGDDDQDGLLSDDEEKAKATHSQSSRSDDDSAILVTRKGKSDGRKVSRRRVMERAEEIVMIVDQVQKQYAMLEEEMKEVVLDADQRKRVAKSCVIQSAQTELAGSDLNDMQEHFNRIREQLQYKDVENQSLIQQLEETRFELDRLRCQTDGPLSMNDNLKPRNNTQHQYATGITTHRSMGVTSALLSNRGPHSSSSQLELHQLRDPNTLITVDTQGSLEKGGKIIQTGTSQIGFSSVQLSKKHGANDYNQQQLQTRLVEMQDRENQLLEQLSQMREQLKFQTSQSDGAQTLDAQVFAKEHLELRVGELETVIFQQREQILQLKDECMAYQRQLQEERTDERDTIELLEMRNRNLAQLNKAHESGFAGIGASDILKSFTSGVSVERGSTQVETERMKQYVSQIEMRQMDLKHELKEAQLSLAQAQKAKKDYMIRNERLEQELIELQQNTLITGAGLKLGDSKLATLVVELKKRIKLLENQQTSQIKGSDAKDKSKSIQRNGSINLNLACLENGDSLFSLKEEYCTKLQKLVEQNQAERKELQGVNLSQKQKCDSLLNQIKNMEEKELKLFSQLEEVKSLRLVEEESYANQISELHKVLESKNQVLSDLQREVKVKEKTLSERQDQIAILLSALEQSNTNFDENETDQVTILKNKLANLATELCSLKAVEAQMERKVSEYGHNERKGLLITSKQAKEIQNLQAQIQTLERKIRTLESSLEFSERQKSDLQNELDEASRDKEDNKYKQERLQFQIKTKEETIIQLKTQVKNAEIAFKEQIDKIKEDLLFKQPTAVSHHFSRSQMQNESQLETISKSYVGARREVALKIAIQQLHLVIADYIERCSSQETSVEQAQRNIIEEMEKALTVAQTTIQKLEADLDREKYKSSQLENEWDSLALNTILINRHEQMTAQIKAQEKILDERQIQSSQAIRSQLESYKKLTRTLEIKIENQSQNISGLEQELFDSKQNQKKLSGLNNELESKVLTLQQEYSANKIALEKKLEIQVDERYRLRDDSIKSYFETCLSKLLQQRGKGQDESSAHLLGKELSALQLLLTKQSKQLDAVMAEKESIEITMQYFKNQLSEQDSKYRQEIQKLILDKKRNDFNRSSFGGNFKSSDDDNNSLKRINLELQKEIIQVKEALELKQGEIASLQMRIESQKLESQLDQENLSRQQLNSDTVFSDHKANQKVRNLQEQLIELRSSHIQELEEMKVHFELELAEARREISLQKHTFEQKFMPGTAPGEILEQNQDLREQLDKYQHEQDCLLADLDVLRKQLDEANRQIELSNLQCQDYSQALQDFEQNLIFGNNQGGEVLNQQRSAQTMQPKSVLKSTKKSLHQSSVFSLLQENVDGGKSGFTYNPPVLIKELMQAKRAELQAKAQLRSQLITETKLRQQLTTQLQQQQLPENGSAQMTEDGDLGMDDVLTQLMNQNANILTILQESQLVTSNANCEDKQLTGDQLNVQKNTPAQDFDTMVRTVIFFINMLSFKEHSADQLSSANANPNQSPSFLEVPLQTLSEAQRIVIRSLAQRQDSERIKYAPERELDRRIWYLELLEEQVGSAEQQITQLQDFVKRLQIGVSGNLHSAAEIKATSMDLAVNLKETSEEIKTLRNVAGLIKHDVLSIMQKPNATSALKNPLDAANQSLRASAYNNPFLDQMDTNSASNPLMTVRSAQQIPTFERVGDKSNLMQSQQSVEKILQDNESMQNQLSLTTKIKQSLEADLVNQKLTQATELQQIIQKFSNAEKRLQSLVKENSDLKAKIEKSEAEISRLQNELKDQTSKLSDLEFESQKAKLEHLKAKEQTKHLSKIQADMAEWRKSTDTQLKDKTKEVLQLREMLQGVQSERDKIKAEVGMLRRNQKEIRDGKQAEQVKAERDDLLHQLDVQVTERRKELEFWMQERAVMRDKIDQLEAKVSGGLPDNEFKSALGQNEDNKLIDRLSKRVKSLESDLKKAKSDALEQKNQEAKLQLQVVDLEAKLREAQTEIMEACDQQKVLQNKIREVEIEKDMVTLRVKQSAESMDTEQVNFMKELESLRRDFAKLKVTNDNNEMLINKQKDKEKIYQTDIESLKEELVRLQRSLTGKDAQSLESIKIMEQKGEALIADLKFMRQENQKLHAKVKEANDAVVQMETQVAELNIDKRDLQDQITKQKKQINETELKVKDSQNQVFEIQTELQVNEADYFTKITEFQKNLKEIKNEASQGQQLMQAQIESLRQRLLAEKKVASKEIDQSLSIAQKETLLKSAKKEIAQLKGQVAKLKIKNKDLKNSLDMIPQKQPPSQSSSKTQQPQSKQQKHQQPIDTTPQQRLASLLAVKLLQISPSIQNGEMMLKLLAECRAANKLEQRILEVESELAKVENWNQALSQQLDEARFDLEDAEDKIGELKDEKKEVKQQRRQHQLQTERALREQLRTAQHEISMLREEWTSPNSVRILNDKISALQATVKAKDSELSRKSKYVDQVKMAKEVRNEEQASLASEVQSVKEENARLKNRINELTRQEKGTRDLRSQVDWLTKTEKRLKEEISTLNDKLKQTKTDLMRKDQLLKDYKDRLDFIQTEVGGSSELKAEIERLKELSRRQKLDIEVKENQVRSLKSRLSQNQEEIESLNQLQQDNSQVAEIEKQLWTQKNKSKRYETNFKRSIQALKQIGVELVAIQQSEQKKRSAVTASNSGTKPLTQGAGQPYQTTDEPMLMGELDKHAQYYKDSVEILGLDMNELETFINPHMLHNSAQKANGAMHGTGSAAGRYSLLSSQRGTPLVKTHQHAAFVEKLEMIDKMGTVDAKDEIEQIGAECMKILSYIGDGQ